MKRIGLSTGFAVTALVAAMSTASIAQAGVTDEDILNDQMTTEDVVTNGLGVQGQRFSPLTKLNSDNVQELRPVWSFSFGGEKQRGQESQPMVIWVASNTQNLVVTVINAHTQPAQRRGI